MTHEAVVCFLAGLVAIVFGFLFTTGAPIALTVAVDRAKELPRRPRPRAQPRRYPYR